MFRPCSVIALMSFFSFFLFSFISVCTSVKHRILYMLVSSANEWTVSTLEVLGKLFTYNENNRALYQYCYTMTIICNHVDWCFMWQINKLYQNSRTHKIWPASMSADCLAQWKSKSILTIISLVVVLNPVVGWIQALFATELMHTAVICSSNHVCLLVSI